LPNWSPEASPTLSPTPRRPPTGSPGRCRPTHHGDDDLYHQGKQTFGAAGVFEVGVLTGIYHTVCGILNAFNIPAPDHDA